MLRLVAVMLLVALSHTAQFTIGTGVSCSDGAVGRVSRVIVDPVA